MRKARAIRGITVVEAAFISSITVLLGFVLIFLASGWAQISMHDLAQKTNEHIQSFRSLLVVELVKYSESGVEIKVRNVSKWNASLKIVEVEVLRDGEIMSQLPENVVLAKDEAASLPIPVDCKRGRALTTRIKYMPLALSERGLPPLVLEFNFTCPISTIPVACNIPEEWAIIDLIDPVTRLSGELSKEYPFIWIRAPLGSMKGDKSVSVLMRGREGGYAGNFFMRFPSAEQMAIRISGENLRPPYTIVLESSSITLIPRNFMLGALVEDNEAKAHVSGVTILWRPEDKIAEGAIVELGVLAPGDYVIRINLKDCHGDELLALRKYYSSTGERGTWDFLYVRFTEEIKITDIYSVEVSVDRGGA